MAALTQNVSAVKSAFSDIKSAIENKGVAVADGTPVTEYANLIGGISGGVANIFASTDYAYLFYGEHRANIFNSGIPDTSHVTNFISFAEDNTGITRVPLDFDTSSATSIRRMFRNCTNISVFPSYLNLTSLTASYGSAVVADYAFYQMGKNTSSLGEITVDLPETLYGASMFQGSFFTAIHINSSTKITYGASMFRNIWACKAVTGLNLSECSNISQIFTLESGTSVLETLELVGTIPNLDLSLSKHNVLSHDSLMNVINALCENGTKKLTLGETNLAKLTDEEKAIATSKGWTLA